jgi:hypothetical protein
MGTWIRNKVDAIIRCRASLLLRIVICTIMAPVMMAAGAIIGLSIGFATLPVIAIVFYGIMLPINIAFSFDVDFFLFLVIIIYGSIILGALSGAFVAIDLSRKLFSRKLFSRKQ